MHSAGQPKLSIEVKSHIGRDVLQSAAVFKTAKAAVWEYVANGLQYIDEGSQPIVKVTISNSPKKITIADNGRGMNWDDLQNFFTMHGENQDKKKGKAGRGYFGTGKSAAFGVAGKLIVTSVKNGKRSKVSLTREQLEKSDGGYIPVQHIEHEVACNSSNGTIIEIEQIFLSNKMSSTEVQEYIELHIAKWKNASVFVDGKRCEYQEPPISEEYTYLPDPSDLPELEGTKLIIKISAVPIEEKEVNGISIYSNGVWHETTLAEAAGKEMSKYILGELEVPKLLDESYSIPAIDLSRSMRLNTENPVVAKAYNFLGRKVEEIRKRLVEKDKDRKLTEEQRRLKKEADKIADILNQDFVNWRSKLTPVQAKLKGGDDKSDLNKPDDTGNVVAIAGDKLLGTIVDQTGELGGKGESQNTTSQSLPDLAPVVELNPDSKEKVADTIKATPSPKAKKGGFNVDFQHLTDQEQRAKYLHEDKTIIINLDHPQLKIALKDRAIEDPVFRRLAYEVAFVEYAIGLAYELVQTEEHFFEMHEPLGLVREIVDRLTRIAAPLYAA